MLLTYVHPFASPRSTPPVRIWLLSLWRHPLASPYPFASGSRHPFASPYPFASGSQVPGVRRRLGSGGSSSLVTSSFPAWSSASSSSTAQPRHLLPQPRCPHPPPAYTASSSARSEIERSQ